MAPPKAGRRGDLAVPLQRRERPYREEHHASTLQRPAPPLTWEACVAWFRDAWEASLPTRLHQAGVEPASALGSPRLAGAARMRLGHVTRKGWGVTGWDRDGQPRGVDDDGLTRDPFLFHLEMRLRSKDATTSEAAQHLVTWAYLGYDTDHAAHDAFVTRLYLKDAAPSGWALFKEGFESMLERTIRKLWDDCQREPVRHTICPECRRRRCECGERSEAQVRAEEAV